VSELSREQDCEQVQALLDAFLAGTLPPADEQRVRAHLEACQDCRDELWALRLGRRARDLLVPEPGYEGELARRHSQVLERLRRSGRPMAGIRHLRRWWWVAVGIAAALIAAVTILEFRVPVERGTVRPVPHVAQVPRRQTGDVTQVTFMHDDVQIVWVFDLHFEP
jgi:predicted anti-sigma-YlaC factor YlaD